MLPPLHQGCTDHGLFDGRIILGHGDQHAQLPADGLGLAQNDVEHKAVHRVVFAVQHGAAYFFCLLPEAVNPAFALFVAGGVPGQVIVHDRREQMLQVDAFGQAVGGNQNAGLGLFQAPDALAAFFGCEFTCDRFNAHPGESFFQVRSHIMGCGYVTAEYHRPKTVLQQLPDMLDERGQFGVASFAGQAFGVTDQGL